MFLFDFAFNFGYHENMEASYRFFKNLSPSDHVSLHLTIEPRPSATTHLPPLEPSKLLKTIEK